MIVISGALVLIAAVLLVLGIALPELNVVYASIGVSLLAFAFLIVGVLQRRGESPTGAQAAGAAAPRVTSSGGADDGDSEPVLAPTAALLTKAPAAARADVPVEGTVLVVPGRPRYHVDGCRYLADKQVEERDVAVARAEGLTNCGVCDPDTALAHRAQDEPAGFAPDSAAPDAEVSAPLPTPTRRSAARRSPASPVTETPQDVAEAAAAVAPASRTPRTGAAKAPAKAPVRAAKAPARAKAPSKAGTPAKAATRAPSSAAPTKAAPVKAARATTASKATASKATPAAAAIAATTAATTPAPAPAKAAKTTRAAKAAPAAKAPARKAPAKKAAATKAPAKRTTPSTPPEA